MNFGANSNGKFSTLKVDYEMRRLGSGRRFLRRRTQDVVHLGVLYWSH
jgi:hypothetical protein